MLLGDALQDRFAELARQLVDRGRRVLAAISNTMDTGDVTTLANPDIVEQIRVAVQGNTKAVTRDGPEDLKRFGEV